MPEFDVWSDGDQVNDTSHANMIKEVDRAIHPDGSNMVVLLQKGRGDPETKPQRDHILSRAIRRGRLHKDLHLSRETKINALEGLLYADNIHSIGNKGMSRDELIEMTGVVPVLQRNGRRPGNGGGGDSIL